MQKSHRSVAIRLMLLAVFALALNGCLRSKAARFYLIDSVESLPTVSSFDSSGPDAPSVIVGPVSIPDYLDRSQIVTRSGPYKIELAEFDRWAEPLKHNLSRVFTENLSHLLGSEKVYAFPSEHLATASYQVPVAITQMEGALGNFVRLQGRWSLYGNPGKAILAERKFSYQSESRPATYEELVDQYSQLIARLSQDIVAAISSSTASK